MSGSLLARVSRSGLDEKSSRTRSDSSEFELSGTLLGEEHLDLGLCTASVDVALAELEVLDMGFIRKDELVSFVILSVLVGQSF